MEIFRTDKNLKAAYVKADQWAERDAGKTFLLTEWPAEQAEEWAVRAIIAFNRGGGTIPTDIVSAGMQAIFWVGVDTFLRGQMKSDEVLPIFNQLLGCAQIVRDPSKRDQISGRPVAHPILAGDIQEVKTRLWLRSEVLRLHTGFSPGDVLLSLISGAKDKADLKST